VLKLTVLRVSEESEKDHNYQACLAMIKHCMLPHEIISDRPRVMRECRGLVNPMFGFVIKDEQDYTIRSFMDMAKFINDKGLMPL
jgi:hypothetical protein